MQKLNNQIIKLVTKYPFLTDPIVLFNPSRIPSEKEILSGELNLVYPEIDKNLKNIEQIKEDFFKVTNLLIKTKFDNLYLEVEVSERLKDFHKIIRIIEIFYEKEEYEKYNLINEYFGIDFELLEEIFDRRELLETHFQVKEGLLKRKKIKKLEETFIDSQEIKFYFDEALRFLELDTNWKVRIGDVISVVHTNFNATGGDIMIPENHNIDIKRLLGLIAHEIDGHCMQFTNCDCLSGGTIRYSKSESLVEGYAMYIEYLFESKIFGEKEKIYSLINRSYAKFNTLNDEYPINKYLELVSGNGIRFFRGFSDIKNYKNLKDFVYIQGLYKIIKFSKKYSNTFSLLKSGAINKSYIKKFGIKEGRKEKINIKKSSAYYILKKHFTK